MIHSFDSQLQVSLRALEEVVAPALAGAEKYVIEQLMLSIVTIGFVKTRLPEARRFYRMELRSCIEIARTAADIADASGELAEGIKAGEQALADPEADIAEFETASRALRDSVTALSHASVGQPFQLKLEAAILNKSSTLVAQYRQWCLPFGFELHPEALPKAAW
jgi:hypothetical protein